MRNKLLQFLIIIFNCFIILSCPNPFLIELLVPFFPEDCNACTVTNTATCTAEGIETKVCQKYRQHNTTREADALGHNLTTININAACTTDGSEIKNCIRDNCGHSEMITIPVLGHNLSTIIVNAVCTTDGSTTINCIRDNCVHSETETIPATGHYFNFESYNCTALCFDFEMVPINGGTFSMGQTGVATPIRQVTLTDFNMSKFLVTQELYQFVMDYNPSEFNANPTTGEVQEKRPVDTVNWYDVIEFCNKLSQLEGLIPVYTIEGRTPAAGYPIINAAVTPNWNNNGYRLPTEAQWEYACRAGTTTNWFSGDTTSELENYAWYNINSGSMTHQVGLKLPNSFGLYDMHGNVQEWCWDRHNTTYDTNDLNDPKGPASGDFFILRGGSWENSSPNFSSAARFYLQPSGRQNNIGFRLVRP